MRQGDANDIKKAVWREYCSGLNLRTGKPLDRGTQLRLFWGVHTLDLTEEGHYDSERTRNPDPKDHLGGK